MINAEGGAVDVLVTSSGDWTLTESSFTAVKPSINKGKDGQIVTFTIEKNADTSDKVYKWKFVCGKAEADFSLTVKGAEIIPDHLKLVSDSKVILNEKAGEIIVKLETSLNYRSIKYNISNEALGWIKHVVTMENDGLVEVRFSYENLDGLKDRNAEITIIGEGVEPIKVNIQQNAKKVLNVARSVYSAPVEGGSISVTISTNVKYDVIISNEDQKWITVEEKKEDAVLFKIEKLIGSKRSAKIIIKQTGCKSGEQPLSAEILVSQLNTIVRWAANMKGSRLFPKWEGGGLPKESPFTLETLVRFDNFDKMRGGIYTIMGGGRRFPSASR